MATWTYENVSDSDKNYLDSFTAVGWVALTTVMDIYNCDVTKINTKAKRIAVLQSIADELSLGTVPNTDWIDVPAGKMVILTVGNNTVTIRYVTSTNTAYIEIFLVSKFPPDFLNSHIIGLIGGTNVSSTNHMIPRY